MSVFELMLLIGVSHLNALNNFVKWNICLKGTKTGSGKKISAEEAGKKALNMFQILDSKGLGGGQKLE